MGIKINIDIEETATAALNQYAEEIVLKLARGIARGGAIVEGEAKANAPVDTGRLRSSITSQADGTQCEIGTNVEYAIYQEFGTYKMAAHPFLVPALKGKENEVIEAIKEELNA